MLLGRFNQTEVERKRYTIEYEDWLDAAEFLSTVTFVIEDNTVSPVLVVNDITIDIGLTLVAFFVSGGVLNTDYNVYARIVTTNAQTKEDRIVFAIRDT